MKFLKKLRRIKEGWTNFILNSSSVEALAFERAQICAQCELSEEHWWLQAMGDEIHNINGMICSECKCPLSAKVRSVNESCPHPNGPKW